MYSALFPLDIMWQAAPSYSILKGLSMGYFMDMMPICHDSRADPIVMLLPIDPSGSASK